MSDTSSSMNKNWNDRADRDLFFTILSVKNIGVISGPEWITIGNSMRLLGHGFTNEGCRQHFQGLRRAQQKAETSGPLPSPSPKMDPTQNPITRRPGPGRGRPSKRSQNPSEDTPSQSQTPTVLFATPPVTVNFRPALSPAMPGHMPPRMPSQMAAGQLQLQLPGHTAGSPSPRIPLMPAGPELQPQHVASAIAAGQGRPASSPGGHAHALPSPGELDELDEPERHPAAKRQKMEPLDDEAVLALTAHNSGAVDHYATDFGYADSDQEIPPLE